MTRGKWLHRLLSATVTLSFVLSVVVVAPSVSADSGTSEWQKQATPTEDDLVLLPGSDVIDFDVTDTDGTTIYAIGTWYSECGDEWSDGAYGPDDLYTDNHFPKLWKSEDGGITWDDITDEVIDATNLPDIEDDGEEWNDFTFFTAVSAAPDDPDFVVVAGWGYDSSAAAGEQYVPVVVGSNDGGDDFSYMGCSTVTGMITCVDVSMEVDDTHSIAVGTWDWENEVATGYANDSGAIWRYDAGGYWSAYWADATTYDGWYPVDAVIDLEFSPNFDVDDSIIAQISVGF